MKKPGIGLQKVCAGIFLLSFMILACCRTSQNHPADSIALQENIKEKLGEHTITELNTSGTHALVKQIEEASRAGEPVLYLVVRLKDQSIVHEGRFSRGYVKWIDDETIELLNLPGKMRADEEPTNYVRRVKIGD